MGHLLSSLNLRFLAQCIEGADHLAAHDGKSYALTIDEEGRITFGDATRVPSGTVATYHAHGGRNVVGVVDFMLAMVAISPVSDGLDASERALIDRHDPATCSQVIQVIKSVRARTGCGLRDAKEIVDKYRATLPPTHAAYSKIPPRW